jgi:phosphate transport system protein
MTHGTHTSRDFESELRELRAHALAMGARCERGLQLALKAFWEGSEELSAEVEELDRHIDRDEMDIDALVLRILALRQPGAYDLRFLAGALRLVTDLERIGDEAVNIAERAKEEHGTAKDIVRGELKTMGEQSQEMLRDALDAFVQGEATRAEQVLVRDDAVDELYGRIIRAMTGFMTAHPAQVAEAIRVITSPSTSSGSPTMRPTSPKRSSSWSAARTSGTSAPTRRPRCRRATRATPASDSRGSKEDPQKSHHRTRTASFT